MTGLESELLLRNGKASAALVFDLSRIASNMQRIADAARAARISPLFAVKSFPHPRVIELAARVFDGFDVASRGELALVPHDKLISVADPTGQARGAITVCETVEQVRAASGAIAIRVSASITGRDPAIGAILDGTGHRRSRFGLDTHEAIARLREAAGARRVGLHVHHGPVTAVSAERFIATARAAIELAGFVPDFLDLGGAWHGIDDIADAFAQIRAAFDMEILVEPGRACADGAGFAVGRVMSRREVADRLVVVSDLSRVCHLKWSQVELVVAKAPHPGAGRKLLVTGATCYEEDVIGEWTVDDIGDHFVLRNVSGYAYAWNTSFGGVPAADVVFVD